MVDNAKNICCDFLYNTNDEKYAEEIRQFQGCPTIAITKGGRIFLGWYAGGTTEPHMDNYNLLIYSDDKGKSWSKPVLIIPSNKEKCIHALDIQLWIGPDNKLYVFWVQNNTRISTDEDIAHKEWQTWARNDGFDFFDWVHAEWLAVCDNPDDSEIIFDEPRYIDKGFLRCKPTVLENGRWILCNYDQTSTEYGYSISDDNGKTFRHCYGAEKVFTSCDEPMVYQKRDGTLCMYARTNVGQLAKCESYDNGETWGEAKLTGIKDPGSRFFISRTPTGKILLVNNDHTDDRYNMTVYLSDDDGETWKYKRCIDSRCQLSYPDVDFYDGRIYLTYDYNRKTDAQILFTSFTEDDIMNVNYVFDIKIVSKPNKQQCP